MKKRKFIVSIMVCAVAITSVLSFGNIGAFASAQVTVTDSSGNIMTNSTGQSGTFSITKFVGGRLDGASAMKKAMEFVKSLNNDGQLSDSNRATVSLTAGEYNIQSNIILQSNMNLNLGDVKLYNYRDDKGNIFLSANPETDYVNNGYYGFSALENVTVTGGVLDYDTANKNGSCLVRLAHCNNVKFDGTSFLNNYYSHHIEIAACKNTTFVNCTFEGQVSNYKDSSSEALQIDILEPNTHFSNFPYYDGTMSENITVEKCTFKNLVAGVGTRSSFAGIYQTNIAIKNNYFENIQASAIVATNYISSTITDNTIVGCGEGISYYMDKQTGELCFYRDAVGNLVGSRNTNCNTVISGNNITADNSSLMTPRGIYIYGSENTSSNEYAKGNYAVYNLTVNNNTISSTGHGIYVSDMQSSTVTGNKINCTNSSSDQYGVSLSSASTGNNISSNTFTGFKYAVCIMGASSSNGVSSNNISSPLKQGIAIFNLSNNNTINANSVLSSGGSGIYAKASTGLNIDSNSITSPSGYGIELESKADSNITSNTIVGPKKSGITVQSSSSVPTMTGNTVSNSGGNGIYLNSSSATTLTSNSVSGCSQQGINVSTSSNAYNVSGNVVSSCGQNGIRVYKSQAFTVSSNTVKSAGVNAVIADQYSSVTYINGNSISSPTQTGICINNSSVAKQINGNSISKTGKIGIAVISSSTATIKSNSISSSGTSGIYATKSSSITAKSNTIKKSNSAGIYISNKAKATIQSNKISSSKSNGIYVSSNSATVSSNTLTSNGGYGMYFKKSATISYKNNSFSKNKKGNAYSQGTKSYKFSNLSKPKTPTLYKSKTKVTVKYKKVSNANRYYIYRSTSKSSGYKKIASTKSLSYTDKSKKTKGKTYYYKVVAVRTMNKVTAQSSISSYKSQKI